MKHISVILSAICIVLFFSCKKEKPDNEPIGNVPPSDSSLKDFQFIPIKDARWKIYVQGSYDSTFNPNYHFYYDIVTTAKDTIVGSNTYHIYDLKMLWKYKTELRGSNKGYIYLREDTAAKKVFYWYRYGTETYLPDYTLADYDINVNDTTYFWQGTPSGFISRVDSTFVGGRYIKLWYRWDLIQGQESVYLGTGIGTRYGLMRTPFLGNGGNLKTLDFYYKSDSLHFSF